MGHGFLWLPKSQCATSGVHLRGLGLLLCLWRPRVETGDGPVDDWRGRLQGGRVWCFENPFGRYLLEIFRWPGAPPPTLFAAQEDEAWPSAPSTVPPMSCESFRRDVSFEEASDFDVWYANHSERCDGV